MAEFVYESQIDDCTPREAFEVASRVDILPDVFPGGLQLRIVEPVDHFAQGVHLEAGLAAGWFPWKILGEITVFDPPRLYKVEASSALGRASLTLEVRGDDTQKQTSSICTLVTEPNFFGSLIEYVLNPELKVIMDKSGAACMRRVEEALERNRKMN